MQDLSLGLSTEEALGGPGPRGFTSTAPQGVRCYPHSTRETESARKRLTWVLLAGGGERGGMEGTHLEAWLVGAQEGPQPRCSDSWIWSFPRHRSTVLIQLFYPLWVRHGP